MTDEKGHDDGLAERHGRALLERLGVAGRPCPRGEHPALAWRRAGLMALTGPPDRPGLMCPVPLTSAADGVLSALQAIAPQVRLSATGAALLGERARFVGLSRRGAVSPNGTCRLIATIDGHVALNLARPDDWDMLPALFERKLGDWAEIERAALSWSTDALVDRGVLLGMAIAADRDAAAPTAPFRIDRVATPGRSRGETPLVVDLSSLWAGPLAGSLLHAAGARVIKVESCARPDGARWGNARFFELLNGGKESVAFDFANAAEMKTLRQMVETADIVIESSRPRALEQLGFSAAESAASGKTWVSITAHGRTGDAAARIGFGDDAAIAGGLGSSMRQAWGVPLFAGDAIADPLTGLTAALAAWAGWLGGGGCMIALALADVVAHARALSLGERIDIGSWQALAEADRAPCYPLRGPPQADRRQSRQ